MILGSIKLKNLDKRSYFLTQWNDWKNRWSIEQMRAAEFRGMRSEQYLAHKCSIFFGIEIDVVLDESPFFTSSQFEEIRLDFYNLSTLSWNQPKIAQFSSKSKSSTWSNNKMVIFISRIILITHQNEKLGFMTEYKNKLLDRYSK